MEAAANVPKANASNSAGSSTPAFAARVCLDFLRQSQNDDGGWGYQPGSASGVEPTAWSLLALQRLEDSAEALARGTRWLLAGQAPDGSWSTRPNSDQGNWITSLAALTLAALRGPAPAIGKAAEWVCRSEPGEVSVRSRFRRWIGAKGVVEQDFSLRGWSWTPGTASWVEPTAVALLFLRQLSSACAPHNAAERRRSGQAMLYNRMCPGGGWNLGNPKVYGVAGIPQIGPTAWPLLALQDQASRSENRQSLDWLEKQFETIGGPSSLALAHLALQANGRRPPALEPRLLRLYEIEAFLDNTLAYAQAAFALQSGPDVLRWATASP